MRVKIGGLGEVIMTTTDLVLDFATAVRQDRRANVRLDGDGTALELLIAPRFRSLIEQVFLQIGIAGLAVLPEYTRSGIGRPDLAFARPAQLARSFMELKEPRKTLNPGQWHGHDADQFRRFGELPTWALSNFVSI